MSLSGETVVGTYTRKKAARPAVERVASWFLLLLTLMLHQSALCSTEYATVRILQRSVLRMGRPHAPVHIR